MKKRMLSLLLCGAMCAGLLSGCGNASSAEVLNVYNWGEYIDTDLIDQFEEETGIKVIYNTFDSNENLYSRIQTTSYDVIIPSDYAISRFIDEDMLQPLNYDHIPNMKLIDEKYTHLDFDPEQKYSVPYTWGTLGIIYNPTLIGGDVDSWGALFDSQYAGKTAMIGNPRDAMAAALMYLGYSINTDDQTQIQQAYQLIADAKANGQYQGFFMDEIYDKMEVGETALCSYYAGDYLSMYMNNPDLKYVIPKEGSNWFVDAMCILKSSQHMSEAEEWINFIASTDSNLANMDYIWYASPNREALEQYPAYYAEVNEEELDPEIYEIMAPPAETLDRCEIYENLPKDTLRLYDRLWTRLGV
mgnify:CR=1 FL=1